MSLDNKSPLNNNGFVISDLHLFTRRSNLPHITDVIGNLAKHNNFCVLNGDIFDFKWSYFDSTEETIQNAIEWLTNLTRSNPSCQFHYILGNHDCLELFVKRLDTISGDNFAWHSTHVRFGATLLLHGDLPLLNKDPFNRKLVLHEKPKGSLANSLYKITVASRLHKIVSLIFTPSFCAKRIINSLNKHDPKFLDGINNIYFGHTHAPFEDFKYDNILFHNTGSAVKHLKTNILKVSI